MFNPKAPFGLLMGSLQRQVADARLSDPFYDSLEGLLMDLKTVSIVRLVHLPSARLMMEFQI